jgi:hypothetical protein
MNEPPARQRRTLRSAWNVRDSYGWVFLLLILDIALLELLPKGRGTLVVQVVFIAATLVLALRTSDAPRKVLRFGQVGALVASAAAIAIAVAGSGTLLGGTYFLMALMLLVTPPVMLVRLLHHRRVTARTLIGALCVYLMIGLLYTFMFLGLGTTNGGKLFAQKDTTESADCVYFSFITEATVGYGDLTPVGNLPRLMAVTLGLLGQMYLVTTVARLVSLFGTETKPPLADP